MTKNEFIEIFKPDKYGGCNCLYDLLGDKNLEHYFIQDANRDSYCHYVKDDSICPFTSSIPCIWEIMNYMKMKQKLDKWKTL